MRRYKKKGIVCLYFIFFFFFLMKLFVAFCVFFFFFFKQKTAYEMVMSDWSSDVCSSDLWAGSSSGNPLSGVGLLMSEASGDRGGAAQRSEERRVGKECSSPCRSRWSP